MTKVFLIRILADLVHFCQVEQACYGFEYFCAISALSGGLVMYIQEQLRWHITTTVRRF